MSGWVSVKVRAGSMLQGFFMHVSSILQKSFNLSQLPTPGEGLVSEYSKYGKQDRNPNRIMFS